MYAAILALLIVLSPYTSNATLLTETQPIIEIGVDNTRQGLVAIARYSNGCTEPLSTFTKIAGNRIILFHLGESFKDLACTRAIEFQKVFFDLSQLDSGSYQLIDGDNGNVLGEMDHYKEYFFIN